VISGYPHARESNKVSQNRNLLGIYR
jgi:hypothetical protein